MKERELFLAALEIEDPAARQSGQLAGALYGASAIPREWLAKLAWRDKIEKLANSLFEAA